MIKEPTTTIPRLSEESPRYMCDYPAPASGKCGQSKFVVGFGHSHHVIILNFGAAPSYWRLWEAGSWRVSQGLIQNDDFPIDKELQRPRFQPQILWEDQIGQTSIQTQVERNLSEIGDFLEEVYDYSSQAALQHATDLIFRHFDDLLHDEDFSTCDAILRNVDLVRLDTALLRSFLTITAPAKKKLRARDVFYDAAYREMVNRRGEKMAKKLLGRLA